MPVDIPSALKSHMAQWGPALRKEMALAARVDVPSASLRVGTDCSGLEAPIISLRALNIPHQHLFSSEVKEKTRKYIEVNFASASPRGNQAFQLCPDLMMKRDHASLPIMTCMCVASRVSHSRDCTTVAKA